ncbi:MAG: hypothetical protein RIC15_08095 [Vicingaceae bacterium]
MSDSDLIRKALIDIWMENIQVEFNAGRIAYERQLQGFLFHYLKLRQDQEGFEVWIEPTWYKNADESGEVSKLKFIPDMVISRGKSILAIIELKWKPWEASASDVGKLDEMWLDWKNGAGLLLKVIPTDYRWYKNKEEKVEYEIDDHCLFVFAVCSQPGSEALTKRPERLKDNFLFLTAQITENDGVLFESK